MASPTSRSLGFMRARGFEPGVVEKWIPKARKRKDLYGFIDIVAVGDGRTIGVQCTSDSNVASRVKKVLESPILARLFQARWTIEVHGWKKGPDGHWKCRVVNVNQLPAGSTSLSGRR